LFVLFAGSKRSMSPSDLCLSSATPVSSPATTTNAASFPSGGGSGSGSGSGAKVVGGGTSNGSGSVLDAAGVGGVGGNGSVEHVPGTDTVNAIIIEGDQHVIDDEDEPTGKRKKRCTSDVWEHYTKKKLVIEDNGKMYVQH
jgi:hypothetical protein